MYLCVSLLRFQRVTFFVFLRAFVVQLILRRSIPSALSAFSASKKLTAKNTKCIRKEHREKVKPTQRISMCSPNLCTYVFPFSDFCVFSEQPFFVFIRAFVANLSSVQQLYSSVVISLCKIIAQAAWLRKLNSPAFNA